MSFYMMRLIIETVLITNLGLRSWLALAHFGRTAKISILVICLILVLLRSDIWPLSVAPIVARLWPFCLGALIIFFNTMIILDLLRLVMALIGWASGQHWWGILTAKRILPLGLALALIFSVYAYYEAHHPRLVHLIITTDKLPETTDSLRIVMMTDLHIGPLIGVKQLSTMTQLAQSAKPDILVVTGDLVDDDLTTRHEEAALLAAIKPPCGTFAILGNHEFYRGEQNSLDFIKRSDMQLLRGEKVDICGLSLVGLDDEIFIGRNSESPANLLKTIENEGHFVLLLKHRPRPAPNTDGLFDLQLSGHTHGGQIWPGHFLAARANEFLSGLYKLPSGLSQIYVSRGVGYWGMPMRFLAPPEITLIELKRP
ncbi:MAG: metallophosphoesterase [Candidatus Adiutrix sp.]